MDDPMTRSRLDRVNGTRPLGAPDPKRGPQKSLRYCGVTRLSTGIRALLRTFSTTDSFSREAS
jgi:hypothetical protein